MKASLNARTSKILIYQTRQTAMFAVENGIPIFMKTLQRTSELFVCNICIDVPRCSLIHQPPLSPLPEPIPPQHASSVSTPYLTPLSLPSLSLYTLKSCLDALCTCVSLSLVYPCTIYTSDVEY